MTQPETSSPEEIDQMPEPEEESPEAVTDVTELPRLEKPPSPDGDDMDVAESLPPIDDDVELGEEEEDDDGKS